MNNEIGYNQWSEQYDLVINKTRDLEEELQRDLLEGLQFQNSLELGCGTGKNTSWLLTISDKVLAIDNSEGMLNKARLKIESNKVSFKKYDISQQWNFGTNIYDLVSSSLILEHIEKIDFVFNQASKALRSGGHLYIGELHPFKQYMGSKARFKNFEEMITLDCYTHHLSEYFKAAKNNSFIVEDLKEGFDNNDGIVFPRIISFLFVKK